MLDHRIMAKVTRDASPMHPLCIGCGRSPRDMSEYVTAAQDYGMDPTQYVRQEEGTYNPKNGHFCCTECYVDRLGMPSSAPGGWVAP